MIEQNSNVIKDPNIKRIVEYTENSKQVNILDSRFYRRSEKYYPSVTSILYFFPKNGFFHSWLKDVGHNSDIIMRKAGFRSPTDVMILSSHQAFLYKYNIKMNV